MPLPMARPVQRESVGSSSLSGNEYRLDPVHQLPECSDRGSLNLHRSGRGVGFSGALRQPFGDRLHDDGVLLALILGIGEQERQQSLAAEVCDRPEVWAYAGDASSGGGRGVGVPGPGWSEDSNRPERRRGEAECRVSGALSVVEAGVEMIEKQQVLAFDVEYQAFGVHGRGAENTRVEQRIKQERGVAGLGGDSGDAADVDMGAFGAVDEIEIQVDRIFVTAEPGRQTAFDFIEIECGVSLFAYSTPSLSSR